MNWQAYYMGFAFWAGQKSKDATKVGAILVGPEGDLKKTAYNGPPKGVTDLAWRRERPQKYLYSAHAEANLISFCARDGVRVHGCTVYVTHMPCAACARTMIAAGVASVVYGNGTTSMPPEEFEAAAEMFREAGVTVAKADTA